MQTVPLAIEGAWLLTPTIHADDRGTFLEWFRGRELAETLGHRFDLAQANISTSRAGTVRGIHFADVPPGQAKYVTCLAGAVLDVVVDIRIGSPTYGHHSAVVLDDDARHAVYASEGLGHGYMALTDGAVVAYLCSSAYAPAREHGLSPLDPQLGIEWPDRAPDGSALTPLLSVKDCKAPPLSEARRLHLLPTHDATVAYRKVLRKRLA